MILAVSATCMPVKVLILIINFVTAFDQYGLHACQYRYAYQKNVKTYDQNKFVLLMISLEQSHKVVVAAKLRTWRSRRAGKSCPKVKRNCIQMMSGVRRPLGSEVVSKRVPWQSRRR